MNNRNHKQVNIWYLANGNSIHTRRWIEYCINNKYNVTLLTFHPDGESSKIKGLKIYNYHLPIPTLLNYIYFIIRVKILTLKNKPDIYHAQYITHYGLTCAILNPKSFILTIWGSDIRNTPKINIVYHLITKYTIKKAKIITHPGHHILKDINRYNLSNNKNIMINFGINTDKFKKREIKNINKNILKHKRKYTIISTRHLDKIYDIDTYIKAIPEVLDKITEVQFLIAGDGPEKERLIQLVKKLNISENVTFLGRLENDTIPEYLSISDIYVSTSLSDGGLASSTAEAMACELPVIITDFGENKKWIKNGDNGYIFSMKNHYELSTTIISLLNKEDIRKNAGIKARKTILQHFDYENELVKLDRIYNKVIFDETISQT
jgi:L-malate glycosyltransferase